MAIPHPKEIEIQDYDYPLPEERIAQFPLAQRDGSRLLMYRNGAMNESSYQHLPELLPQGSTLVFNNTRVLQARLLFTKESGGQIEIFTLEPSGHYSDIQLALGQQGSVEWNCLVGGASKWKPHYRPKKIVPYGNEYLTIEADIVERLSDSFRIRFSWTPSNLTFPEVLHHAGQVPLPPYLNRDPVSNDVHQYQTVYAQKEGSVAAPTAGLHFTPALMEALLNKGIQEEFLTLHVGAGTFRPVKSTTLKDHEMHSEYIEVSSATLKNLCNKQEKVYAVGTTSLRTLESLYWMGVKCRLNPTISAEDLPITQWEAYDLDEPGISATEAIEYLLKWLTENNKDRLISRTQILIAPGYKFRMVQGLLTNFHQPKSTLLLLIAAMIGPDWKKVYQYALDHEFRFLSYGDGCLLEQPGPGAKG